MYLNVIVEIIRALSIGCILLLLLTKGNSKEIRSIGGWYYFVAGFCLLFFGSLIDITDNFPVLNQFVIIGRTPYQAIIEKIVGYMTGFVLLAFGVWKWSAALIKYKKEQQKKLQKATRELKILQGMLPICSSCKSICDRSGKWNKLEHYLNHHSEAQLTHGICPECTKKLRDK
jgi:uncharacterized membrane protein